ncbi:MAG: 1-acyl-sn-glycerol-3-phosphate acyltransferase [Chitinophagia bacterium]|nr:1-acyl-sn-glycerol-3-phosphate acyltransferase [Chitinophagia bacterium]
MNRVKSILGTVFALYAALMFVATMLVVWLPIAVISTLPEPERAKWLHRVFVVWMGCYMPLIFCPVKRMGRQYFKRDTNYVVVLNHNSMIDIPVSSPWIPASNKTLAKIEMARVPVFGVIYKAGSILLDRKSPTSRRDSLTQMLKTLELGINLCLYPEGTRNTTAEPLQPFFDGAFTVAVRAQKPIMPGIIFNTKRIMPAGKKFWLLPHPIQIHFLEPINTAGLSQEDVPALKQQVYTLMANYYRQHAGSI